MESTAPALVFRIETAVTARGSWLNSRTETVGDASRRKAVAGVMFAASSAVAYTLTNILLRDVAGRSDLGWAAWLTFLKAVPSAVAAWGLIYWGWRKGKRSLGGPRAIGYLVLAGLLMQVGGNLLFQYALSLGGLALTVSLCFAGLIIAGAAGGRLLLNEAVPLRTLTAMGLLIAAVFVLQGGAEAATSVMHRDSSRWAAFQAVFWACVSGACFGLGGVAIRYSMTGTGTLAGTVAPIASTGIVVPPLIAVAMLGVDGVAAIDPRVHASTLLAGTFNAIGFFAVSAAMARIPLTRVNLINSSQAALCAIAGVAWFDEPRTGWVIGGTLLTMASFVILGTGRGRVEEPALVTDADQPLVDGPVELATQDEPAGALEPAAE
jgi:drug/metabolite transporter (DMT)-like permease